MTTLAHRSALQGPRGGGIAARRPLIRWAWRLFRREWRQQILVIALLTVAVAAAIASVTIAYNSGSLDYAEFGSANTLSTWTAADPRKLQASLAAAEQQFGTTDVIGHRSLRRPRRRREVGFPLPGPARTVRCTAPCAPPRQLPGGPRPGRRHRRRRQAPRARDRGTLALDGHRRTVVGIVENPSELSDEFALVSPSSAGAPDHVTVLVDADSAASAPSLDARADRSALVRAPDFEATTSRRTHYRCSPSPPSSCCWLRSLPRQASPSSRSDGSASSACSLRSARPRSTFDSCC